LQIFVKFDRIVEEGGMVMDKTIKNGYNAVIEALSGGGGGGGFLRATGKDLRISARNLSF
jgi:hypothetical protein